MTGLQLSRADRPATVTHMVSLLSSPSLEGADIKRLGLAGAAVRVSSSLESEACPSSLLAAPDWEATLDKEVATLLAKQAIEEIPPPVSPGFYGHFFVVPKYGGGWRLVLDLLARNRFLQRISFHIE